MSSNSLHTEKQKKREAPRSRIHYRLITLAIIIFISLSAALRAADLAKRGERWWAHVRYLADDKLEGRNTGSEGYRKAAAYVAEEFKRVGLKPAGTSGYFQPIRFRSRRILEEKSYLVLVRNGVDDPVRLGEDAIFNLRADTAELIYAPAVFVGFGLTVPEKNHDDLAGLDLRGKIAVFLSGGPSSFSPPLRAHYQTPLERWKFLKRAGAVGTAMIQNPRSMDLPWDRNARTRRQPFMTLTEKSLDDTAGLRFALSINPDKADKFLVGTGHTLSELLVLADSDKPLPKFPLAVSFRAKVQSEQAEVESPNVIGILPGSDSALKDEYIVVSAHLDHIGIAEPIDGDSIYNGAMDDASGVASLLAIAESLKESKKRLRRSLIFLAATGEEKGLLGSKYFATHPTVPFQNIVANLNMDCYLPLFPLQVLTSQGLEESDLGEQLRTVAGQFGIRVQADPEPDRNRFIRSDQYSFIRRGIPALAFKFSYEKGSPEEKIYMKWWRMRYHAPSDDVNQPVDTVAAAKFNQLILALAEQIANRTERPQWHRESFFRRFAQGGLAANP